MILRILEYFIEKSKNPKAKNLMSGLRGKLHPKVVEIKKLLQNEGRLSLTALRIRTLI